MVRSRRDNDTRRQPRHHAHAATLEQPQLSIGHAPELEQVLLHRRLPRGQLVAAGRAYRSRILARVSLRDAGLISESSHSQSADLASLALLSHSVNRPSLSQRLDARKPRQGWIRRLERRHVAVLVRLVRRRDSAEPDLAERDGAGCGEAFGIEGLRRRAQLGASALFCLGVNRYVADAHFSHSSSASERLPAPVRQTLPNIPVLPSMSVEARLRVRTSRFPERSHALTGVLLIRS